MNSSYTSPSSQVPNEYHGRVPPYVPILVGGPERLTELSSSHGLFLCYPPPKQPMAIQALRAYRGNHVALVGVRACMLQGGRVLPVMAAKI